LFNKNFISLIFAAGGVGSRMGSLIPKQYLPLAGRPIALHSFSLFDSMDEIDEIIVVCEPERRHLFNSKKPLRFALPGPRRQDSIRNGLSAVSPNASIICTHDAARPFAATQDILKLIQQTIETGAATLAAPVICTIKQASRERIVEKTLDRSHLWEIQTPQGLRRDLFEKGFAYAEKNKIEVTDDTSLAELLGHPVAIVPSPHRNFKITTPTDLAVANTLCNAIN